MSLERTAGAPPASLRHAAGVDGIIVRRISWGAVIAGAVAALAMHIVLGLLGLAIGASTIDPAYGDTPEASSLGLGATLWWTGSALVAIFIGGWIAGRLSGDPVREDGALHGFVTWGVATVVTVALLGTALGGVLGGGFKAIMAATQDVARTAVVRDTSATVGEGAWEGIDSQIEQLLARAPSSPAGAADGGITQVIGDEELRDTLERVVTTDPDRPNNADREAAINGLTAKTGLTRSQAEDQVTRWRNNYRQAEHTARVAGRKASEGVARAASWLVIALALGAAVGAIGGMLGAPRRVLAVR